MSIRRYKSTDCVADSEQTLNTNPLKYNLMNISLVITTYNWKAALHLVLLSVFQQTRLPEDIIIADDGSSDGTDELVQQLAQQSPVPLRHSWQEDLGFRAAASRNKAIMQAHGDYIVLLDGDMILHPRFIQDHARHAHPQRFVQGGRVLLNARKTQQVLAQQQTLLHYYEQGLSNRKNAIHAHHLARFFSRPCTHLSGIKSCNLAFFRSDFLRVNGFNEDFVGWGREDSEFIVRLLKAGVQRYNLRFNGIAYHLYHTENSRQHLSKNDDLLQAALHNPQPWCDNGCDKYKTLGSFL